MHLLLDKVMGALLGIIPKETVVFIISALPVLELRGGIIAASLLRIHWLIALLVCTAGTVLPVPFILLFIDKIFSFLKKTKLCRMVEFIEEKATNKSKKVLKYKDLGLFLFVAMPLPGMGAWTGALIAALLRMDFKRSLIITFFGALASGVIMLIFSYLIPYLVSVYK